jgi:dCMP deaminase
MNVADVIARRSPCSRRQVGAVIVDETNRIVATGYNGFPRGTEYDGYDPKCLDDCPRAMPGAITGVSYDNCITVHAEANALMFCDRREREGGTIYVTSAICFTCAKQVANSGVARVVMRVSLADKHRKPKQSIDFLEASGLEVIVVEE